MDKVKISISLSSALLDRIDVSTKIICKNRSTWIANAIIERLAQEEKEKEKEGLDDS